MELGSMLGTARKISAWVYGFIERWACRRAYEVSTAYRIHREVVETEPDSLGEHLQYQLFWHEFSHGERQRAPSIEIRAAGQARLSKVVLAVSAFNSKACYQDEVVLRQVDQRRHRSALRSVPFRNLKFDGGLVFTPYDRLRVELIEIRDEAGESLLPSWPVVATTCPMDRLEVALGTQQDYVERWGQVYSLQFIEMEITEQLVHLSAWRLYRSGLVKALTSPLQYRGTAKLLFWLKNAVHARPLERALDQHIAEYTEYAALRESRARESLEA